MIIYAPEAIEHIRALRRHYIEKDRPEAARGLANALEAAWKKIVSQPSAGLPAPRPYPHLIRPGLRWLKSGRYWITYRTENGPAIIAVFYETADIPGRL